MVTQLSFGYDPRCWQDLTHRGRSHYFVLAVHRRAGKTKLAIADLLDSAVRFGLDRGMFGYIAPLRTQAKSIAWGELKSMARDLLISGHAVVKENDLALEMWNGAVVRLFGADDPDSLRGYRWDKVWLDEVAQMKSDVWPEVVMPACLDRNAPAGFIGTPKGVDAFSELYYRGLNDPTGLWSSRRWTVYDTGVFSPEEILRIRGQMSEKAFAREFLCDFEAGAEDQLISMASVEAAAQRRGTERDAFGSPVVLGVDPARFGDDRTVIVRRQGVVCFEPIVMRDADNMKVADVVAQQMDRFDPAAVFIDIGQGAGVVDRLRAIGRKVIEVPFGGKAHADDLYFNRRAEMWCGVRDWLDAGGSIPNDLGLKQELCAPTYTFDPRGRIKLESKDDIVKRIPEMSPDKADALALTFAAPVAAPTLQDELRRRIPNLPDAPEELPDSWDPWE